MKEGTVSHHCISSAWNSGCLARRWGGMLMDEQQQQVVESCPLEAGGDSFGAACPFSSHISQLCVWIYLILRVLPSPFNLHSAPSLSSSLRKEHKEEGIKSVT